MPGAPLLVVVDDPPVADVELGRMHDEAATRRAQRFTSHAGSTDAPPHHHRRHRLPAHDSRHSLSPFPAPSQPPPPFLPTMPVSASGARHSGGYSSRRIDRGSPPRLHGGRDAATADRIIERDGHDLNAGWRYQQQQQQQRQQFDAPQFQNPHQPHQPHQPDQPLGSGRRAAWHGSGVGGAWAARLGGGRRLGGGAASARLGDRLRAEAGAPGSPRPGYPRTARAPGSQLAPRGAGAAEACAERKA